MTFYDLTGAKIALNVTAYTLQTDEFNYISFSLNEPIICPDQASISECAVVVTLTNPDTNSIYMDNCVIMWLWDEWTQVRVLKGIS